MGRKGEFAEKPKKGPGRKAKKQGPPQLTRQFKGKLFKEWSFMWAIFTNIDHENKRKFLTILAEKEQKEDHVLSHRQKQRLGKRLQKQKETKIKMSGHGRKNQQKSRTYNSDTEEESKTENENKNVENSDTEDSEFRPDKVQGFSDENGEWLKPKNTSKIIDGGESGDGTSNDESGDEEMATSSDSESVEGI